MRQRDGLRHANEMPVKVPLPGGEKAVKIGVSWTIVVRCLSGSVYTWGAGDGERGGRRTRAGRFPCFQYPHVYFSPGASYADSGRRPMELCRAQQQTNCICGAASIILCIRRSPPARTGAERDPPPTSVSAPSTIVERKPTTARPIASLPDGNLHAYGAGREQGELGDGTEIDYSRYGGYPLPYGTGYPPATPRIMPTTRAIMRRVREPQR